MNTKPICLSLALLLLSPLVAQAEFTPIAGWGKQLFPSYLIGTAAINLDDMDPIPNLLGDMGGMLGIEVVAPHDDAVIQVTIECNDFAEPSRFTGVLPTEGESYKVFPAMKYKYDRLSRCTQATPATVSFQVSMDGDVIEEKSTTVTFRSINDCPLVRQHGDVQIDTSFAFACYVNEQHPYLDKLLREALDCGVVESFIGYQDETEESVLAQVYAIWDVLVARDVRYSSITQTAAQSQTVFGQNVRLLEDTINNQQANCVDGSVLFVSILRKIGIEADLVLVPGHCYVQFYLDEERTKPLGLETTLMGDAVSEDENEDGFLEGVLEESMLDEYSWPSFVEAVRDGTMSFAAVEEKFGDPEEQDYKLVDISAARQLGVLPVPFRSREEFVSFDHTYEEDDDEDWSDEDDDEDWSDDDEDRSDEDE